MNSRSNPPSWCPEAVATSRGWCHPKTGELLVAIRGLEIKAAKVEAPVVEEKPVEAPVMETPVVEEKPAEAPARRDRASRQAPKVEEAAE